MLVVADNDLTQATRPSGMDPEASLDLGEKEFVAIAWVFDTGSALILAGMAGEKVARLAWPLSEFTVTSVVLVTVDVTRKASTDEPVVVICQVHGRDPVFTVQDGIPPLPLGRCGHRVLGHFLRM